MQPSDQFHRHTTATLDVRGFEFRASGRQPIDLGWRAAFPDWQPADEKGDDAQLLPPLRNGETAQLHDPKIEDKETRPPPRYNEGTLIEAIQNAWRFVDDEVLRERLKEAKGIGTPATRAEIIGGLKKQGFLVAQGKNIVPTEAGLSLFGVCPFGRIRAVDSGTSWEGGDGRSCGAKPWDGGNAPHLPCLGALPGANHSHDQRNADS